MSSRAPFKISLKRQPGYELLLSIRFESPKHTGVLSLSRPGWVDESPSRSHEFRDVESAELRGGRFTLVHDGSERREGYSLARVTEQLMGRIPEDDWIELDPITEFGFRYLQIPEAALSATPAAAAVRTRRAGTSDTPSGREAAAPGASGRPVARAANVSGPGGRSSLLQRARHSAMSRASTTDETSLGAELNRDGPSYPPDDVLTTTQTIAVAQHARSEEGSSRGPSLPPRPKPVASASASGTPAPSRIRETHSPTVHSVRDLPTGELPARPVPVEASLAQRALDGLSDSELRSRLSAEMHTVQDLHLLLSEAERRLGDSQARERDLLALLQTWQDRQTR